MIEARFPSPHAGPLARAATLAVAFAALLGMIVSFRLPPVPASMPRVVEQPRLPLAFTPNVGQASDDVRMHASAPGGMLSFTASGVRLMPSSGQPVAIEFIGANRAPLVEGVERLPGVVNYYGGAASAWHTNVPTYAGVRYQGLYDGIDLRYDSTNGMLKGTYTLAPGANPAQIRWSYSGASGVRVNASTGDLVMVLPGGEIMSERAPVAWQEVDGRRVPVEVRYALADDGVATNVGFQLGAYDPALPLVIDPELVYSSFFGGDSSDWMRNVAVDAQGNVYVTGYTYSDLPGATNNRSRSSDVFVTKINAAGTAVIYTTYLGGIGIDEGYDLAPDAAGNLWLTGETASEDFPMLNAIIPQAPTDYYRNAFVSRLNAAGALSFSSYLGDDDGGIGRGIALDRDGNAYIAGRFAGQLLAVIDAQTLKLVYEYGVAGMFRLPEAQAVAVDGDGQVYLTGGIKDENWPTVKSVQAACAPFNESECSTDAFVLKLDPASDTVLFSTYFGGSAANEFTGQDVGHDIVVDAAGNILITGETFASDFPTVRAFQSEKLGDNNFAEAFVTKFAPQGDGYAVAYSTYLSGKDWEEGASIAVDRLGNAYVTGLTKSKDFPLRAPLQGEMGGGVCELGAIERYCYEAFLTQIAPDGSVPFSTFWGGALDDVATGVAVDGGGNIYVGGYTESSGFPVTTGALQTKKSLQDDGFLLKISSGARPPLNNRFYVPIARR